MWRGLCNWYQLISLYRHGSIGNVGFLRCSRITAGVYQPGLDVGLTGQTVDMQEFNNLKVVVRQFTNKATVFFNDVMTGECEATKPYKGKGGMGLPYGYDSAANFTNFALKGDFQAYTII